MHAHPAVVPAPRQVKPGSDREHHGPSSPNSGPGQVARVLNPGVNPVVGPALNLVVNHVANPVANHVVKPAVDPELSRVPSPVGNRAARLVVPRAVHHLANHDRSPRVQQTLARALRDQRRQDPFTNTSLAIPESAPVVNTAAATVNRRPSQGVRGQTVRQAAPTHLPDMRQGPVTHPGRAIRDRALVGNMAAATVNRRPSQGAFGQMAHRAVPTRQPNRVCHPWRSASSKFVRCSKRF